MIRDSILIKKRYFTSPKIIKNYLLKLLFFALRCKGQTWVQNIFQIFSVCVTKKLNDWTQKELKKKVLEGRPKKLLRNHWHDKKGKKERRLASVEE
jgi:hypothetical protein